MSEKTTHTLLGAFVLVGIAIGVLAVIFSASQGFRNKSAQRVVMVFDGSVTGLNKGAPVAIRGANIGEVVDIRVRFDEERGLNLLMEVEAIINEAAVTRDANKTSGDGERKIGPALIEAGLRAQLNNLSLVTGLLYVQLDFFPETEVTLRALDSENFEIPTIPSPFEKFVKEFDQLNLPRLAADMQAIAASMRSLTESEAFQTLPETGRRALASTEALTNQLQGLIGRMEPQIEQTLASTTAAATTAERELPLIAEQINSSLRQVDATLLTLQKASGKIADLVDPDSPTLYNLNQTLVEIARASRALNTLAHSLEEQPQSLLLGHPGEEE